MDNNNWRPAQEPNTMDGADWRTQLQPDSRQRIVNKIMETLKRYLPISGPEGLIELRKIAVRFEEKIYSAATSQSDYLRKISLKMLSMETKSQNPSPNVVVGTGNQNLPEPGQQPPISLPNQSQVRQQLLSQNLTNNIAPVVQSSSSLSSALSPATNLTPASMANAVGQSSNMHNISGMSQNSVGNSVGQGVGSNIFASSQRPMPGRQHPQQVAPQQNHQQTQNPQEYLYQQQQMQQQIMKQRNIQSSHIPSHVQQQQNLSTQLQSSQQSHVPSSGQSSQPLQQTQSSMTHSGLQKNQLSSGHQPTSSVLQQHQQQSILRQQQQSQQSLNQQQTSISQQQQQLAGQTNATSIQQNQLLGQQNSVPDMQQQQQQQQQQHQQQRLLGQQNNMANIQQHQQLLGQQNSMSNLHRQQLGPQSSVGLQQQQLLGTQSGVSNMQQHPQSMHVLQHQQQAKGAGQQQQTPQTSSSNLLQIPGQQSQSQSLQQQVIPQLQQQQTQLQQHLGLQQQANPLQRDIPVQQRFQSPGLQPHNVIQSRALPETSSTSIDLIALTGNVNAVDWQEEAYQKVKSMKEMYYPELSDMYQKICVKFQQPEYLSQQSKDQVEKMRVMKMMLERTMTFLQVSKSSIPLSYKEKLLQYEKNIVNFLTSNRSKKIPSQQGQQPPQPLPMQQQHPQIQAPQQHDNQVNPQMQGMNLQNGTSIQSTSVTSMPHGSLSSLQNGSHLGTTAEANIMSSLQSNFALENGQRNASNSMQQGAVGSMQQNNVTASQQGMNTSQSGVSGLQPNVNPIQLNPNMLQHQQLKQEQEHQLLQSQQMKQQFQQRHIQQQLLQKQQILQQQNPQLQQQFQPQLQQKQQQSAQMQTHQMPQLHQMNEDIKIRQSMGFKAGIIQQHHTAGQRSGYHHQQLKAGAQFPISSPQLHPAASPQISQHSPQIDQQSLLSSLSKAGTPLQSANSPFIVPSPSTPLAPSPLPGDSEKQVSGVSSLLNAGNIGQQHLTSGTPAIGTPGISASPYFDQFISPDGNQAVAYISGKANMSEQPLERLIKVVKSISPKALHASVSDIGSVISMIDRIAGSAPGNGSRAAVGEDLVALTKCRMQARNFVTQDGNSATRKMRRDTSAMPLNAVSSAGSVNDSFKHLNGLQTSDLESTATSRIKRPRVEANHALLEEIRDINQRLIDTVVNISDEDVDPAAAAAEGGEGIIVKCTFNAVSLSPNLKTLYASAQMSPIVPLRLLVPTNYPNCSPILLDKFPVELSKEYEDLSVKARSRFNISLRSLSQPMSLGEMVRTWDVCTRAVVADFAQQSGGGSFSSRYGTWDNCVSAS